jgi:hypothetical protein
LRSFDKPAYGGNDFFRVEDVREKNEKMIKQAK